MTRNQGAASSKATRRRGSPRFARGSRKLRRLRRRTRRRVRRLARLARRFSLAVRRSRLVVERGRFARRELLRTDGVHNYRLREGGLAVCVVHGTTSWTFDEIFDRGAYDPPPEVVRLMRESEREASIVDLGGNVGYASARLLWLFPQAEVVAYEPDPAHVSLHAEMIRLNDAAGRWRLVPGFAANRDGRADFVATGTGGAHVAEPGEDADTVTVDQVDVLDELRGAALAKIDIEGAEWAIIGDERFGAPGPRCLVLEYHMRGCPGADPRAEACRVLARRGYQVIEHAYAGQERHDDRGIVWALNTS